MLVVMAALVVTALQALAQGPAPAPPSPAAPKPAVATVGTRRITREEWERRCKLALAEFTSRNGGTVPPADLIDMLRRQVLESQIRMELLVLEAKRTGVTAPASEAENILKQDPFFNPGGKFDENRYMAVRTTQPQAFASALASVQEQLAARKLNDRIEAQNRPEDAVLRANARRSLVRATVEHLSLRRSDFTGTYREPRESDVLDWYAGHAADYARPDRSTLTITFVNSPGLSDSLRQLPGGAEAWSKRMKAVADSVLAVIARGATLESAAGFLGPRPNTVVTSDNFPGYWRAGDELNRQLFDAKNVGRVLPQAFPSVEGWLLVRVDQFEPAHTAPLREVAREIRGKLRKDHRVNADEYELRTIYEQRKDSLATSGWRFRYAVADTGTMRIPAPAEADLDRFYRGHLADYSAFDAKSGAITSRPLAEVREEVRARWYAERRRVAARLQADALLSAWSAGRRDASLESAMHSRDLPPAIRGAVLDSGLAGRVLSDTLATMDDPLGPGMVPFSRGWIVWATIERLPRMVPSFEQARGILTALRTRLSADEEEKGARAMFDRSPEQFTGGSVIHFSRITVPEIPFLEVKLTRAEVTKYYQTHVERYSAPELVTARHILIAPVDPTSAGDQAARRKAEDVLRRAKSGEDFGKLAKEFSDDPATKDQGGALGTFGHGTMMEPVERALFALKPGEFAPAPVKTTLGWHVLSCVDHAPLVIQPLDWIYTIVGTDAAGEKSERLTRERADSLLRSLPTPAAARAVSAKLNYAIKSYTKKVGEVSPFTNTRGYYELLDQVKPGHMVPSPQYLRGQGYWISWVDSISPPGAATWDEARSAALEAYRKGAGQRALDAKKAELDSMLASGWAFDSLAALWGGMERARDMQPGRGLGAMAGAALLDSVAFGSASTPPLPEGQLSGWLNLPGGWARVRVAERLEPTPQQLSARMNAEAAGALERKQVTYFTDLKRRWPVNILDPKMRGVALAEPPPVGTP
jgi:hypothetical protein